MKPFQGLSGGIPRTQGSRCAATLGCVMQRLRRIERRTGYARSKSAALRGQRFLYKSRSPFPVISVNTSRTWSKPVRIRKLEPRP